MLADEGGPILVVDHDDGSRVLTSSMLERAGYRTAEADSGESALAVARSSAPRLALVDVYLPALSGYEVCHQLKEEFDGAFPVVLVSRPDREAPDSVAAFLLGADDCVAKPIGAEQLLARVRGLLERATEAA